VKVNPDSYTCDRTPLFVSTRWGEQLCRKVPDGPHEKQAEHESAAHLCSKRLIEENIPSSEVGTGWPSGNSHKLQERKLQLDIRRRFLAGRVVCWNRLPNRL